MKPELFIGSSVEGIQIAEAIEQNLQHKFNVTLWSNGVFGLSSNTLDDLLSRLDKSDFGVFVFSPDDISRIRDNEYSVVRDNVLFELGLYTGKLGRLNTFFLKPLNTSSDFHLPTDLIGVAIGNYDLSRDSLASAVSVFCGQIKSQIFDNKQYIFNGKWKFSWKVDNSVSYPEIVSEELEVFHYHDKIKFFHTISPSEEYILSGVFRNPYFTGTWHEIKKVGYDGVFQLKINGQRNKFDGIWCGWNNSGGVSSGPCSLEKL